MEDQVKIFEKILTKYFISDEDQHLFELNEESLSVAKLKSKRHALAMKNLVEKIINVSVELQEDIKKMYLNLPARFHYVFNMRNLNRIFT